MRFAERLFPFLHFGECKRFSSDWAEAFACFVTFVHSDLIEMKSVQTSISRRCGSDESAFALISAKSEGFALGLYDLLGDGVVSFTLLLNVYVLLCPIRGKCLHEFVRISDKSEF